MKKVFLVHGFQGSPNGGWRPWLMAELEKLDIYACALAMPDPESPKLGSWIAEIERHISAADENYLVGHSLGVPAILHYLQSPQSQKIQGAVLVSGPAKSLNAPEIEQFIDKPFDYDAIKNNCDKFSIIHGDNDHLVPLDHAQELVRELEGELTIIENGGHLNGSAGFTQLPECLESLNKMFRS